MSDGTHPQDEDAEKQSQACAAKAREPDVHRRAWNLGRSSGEGLRQRSGVRRLHSKVAGVGRPELGARVLAEAVAREPVAPAPSVPQPDAAGHREARALCPYREAFGWRATEDVPHAT